MRFKPASQARQLEHRPSLLSPPHPKCPFSACPQKNQKNSIKFQTKGHQKKVKLQLTTSLLGLSLSHPAVRRFFVTCPQSYSPISQWFHPWFSTPQFSPQYSSLYYSKTGEGNTLIHRKGAIRYHPLSKRIKNYNI